MDNPDTVKPTTPGQTPPHMAAVAGAAALGATLGGSPPERVAVPLSPYERVAQAVCREVLTEATGYQATFSFGTPGGNDLDLRLCFADLDSISQDDIRQKVMDGLRAGGVDVEVDLLFMAGREFAEGIRDLVELGDVSQRLKDGFDPHEQQAAVGDTSMFSLYIFATMRELDRNQTAGDFGSPESALENLALTREGAIGWMHFYTGCFLHEYLRRRQGSGELAKYRERLAKFVSRVIVGSTLAQLEPAQLNEIKPELVAAVKSADQNSSADANIAQVLLSNPHTSALLDTELRELLLTAGDIRSGRDTAAGQEFLETAESRLFYEAFQQGIDRRPEIGEEADPLTSYALAELVRDLGQPIEYSPGVELMRQGDIGGDVIYIPPKTADGEENGSVTVEVRGSDGQRVASYVRTPGRIVGEGAIFKLPRSATVKAGELPVQAYRIDAETMRSTLSDPDIRQQLEQPVLETREARRMKVVMLYLAGEGFKFTRQTLPYTSLAGRDETVRALGDNPLQQYNMGLDFRDTLQYLAQTNPDAITILEAGSGQTKPLFDTGQSNDRLYVVSEGTVEIQLKNGESVTLQPGEFFGESSMLGLPTTGTATLLAQSQVVAVDAQWFKRFTQSQRPIQGTNGVLPVQLLYHLAAEGYDRVRRRLITQR